VASLPPDGSRSQVAGDPGAPQSTNGAGRPGAGALGGAVAPGSTTSAAAAPGPGGPAGLPPSPPPSTAPSGPPPPYPVHPGPDAPDQRVERSPGPAGRPVRSRRRRWLVEWAVILVVALVVALVVRTYVAQTFYIPSTSMYPTLKAGDRIVVNKLAFDFGSIQRGDIVVFRRPPAENCGGPPVPDLVKRVIGLPGNTVSAKDGNVYITGKELKEPWLPHTTPRRIYTTMPRPYKVPPNDYFVMGDNRVNSCDSRMWGPVKRTYIVGKVDLIIWPLGTFHFF